MRLSAKVLEKKHESITMKDSGQVVQLYRLYLAPANPLDGALELSVNEATYNATEKDQEIEVQPTFSTRTWNRNIIVTAKAI